MEEKTVKKILIVCIIILIILLAGLVIFNLSKNSIMMSKIENTLENLNIGTNYSYNMTFVTTADDGKYEANLSMGQYYVNDGKFSAQIKTYGNNGNTVTIAYKDDSDDIILYDNGEKKEYKINGETNSEIKMEVNPTNLKTYSQELIMNLKNNINNITEETKNGKECYVITTNDYDKYWIEKNTGIVISYIQGNDAFDLTYTIGNVDDEDFVKPDTSEYLKN